MWGWIGGCWMGGWIVVYSKLVLFIIFIVCVILEVFIIFIFIKDVWYVY